MLSAFLAFALGVSPASSSQDKSSPVGGSLSGIVTADDYPADALNLNQEGSVGVLVRIDANGAVSDCMIIASSGSPSLDAQTCRLVWLRARFSPARDRDGRPVEATYQQRIVWRIGDDHPGPSEAYMIRWILTDWDDGFPSCRVEFGGVAQGDAGTSRCPPYVAGIPTWLPDRLKPYQQIVVEQRFSVGEPSAVQLPQDGRLIGRELARLDLDAAGNVTSCKVIETTGVMPPQLSRTCLISAQQYEPRKDAKGVPAPFAAYYTIGVYGILPSPGP